jgi:hypothetical protein
VKDAHQDSAEETQNQWPASNLGEQASSAFTFTRLRDQFAQRKRLIRLSSTAAFARCLRATTTLTKAALPWAKLAELGPTRSPAGSSRYDANVVALHGGEGDYDGDEVPIENAAALIQAVDVEAVLNETTTPGHWRIWLPTSRAYLGAPDELRALRASWVARANGVLGGILAPESFVLSQAFYVGGIKGKPTIRVIVTRGTRIDTRDDLDALYASGKSEPTRRHEHAPVPDDQEESDDDPRLLREGLLRKNNFHKTKGHGTCPLGHRVCQLIQWLGDMGTEDGLIASAEMIADILADDYEAPIHEIERLLAKRQTPRGWDVIDEGVAAVRQFQDDDEVMDATLNEDLAPSIITIP